ncbi:MAG TPA: alpha/beta hydrolase [Dyella sp.]|uniref:alpha/beta fold hydrolase n=1 Tax=Dyella sp. TaxID=1869338 RepID=UPI002C832838|nr:alpha/beta hydrolase [Dyella sp.]HTV87171.1 alpha/beta hydrolase [Dyella sp.]
MNANHVTVVFAHGAWADESSWDKVVQILQTRDVKTRTFRLPLSSLADDAAALDKTLADIDGAVVLVGHAYAGAVIASTRNKRVRALVYIAALAPDEGETVADVFNRYGHDETTPQLAPDSDGWIHLPSGAFAAAFAQDASPDEQRMLEKAQLPISVACITVPVAKPLWRSVPSWFLVAERDHMIPEKTQRFMAERMKASIDAQPVDHVPIVTAPDAVAKIVLEAISGSDI